MKLTIYPSKLSGYVNIVSSKSLSHRYMIAASLATGKSKINNVLNSKDLEATINILKNFNVNIKNNNNDYIIDANKLSYPTNHLDAYESGSTLRFFIPIAWLFDKIITFTGSPLLGQRPLNVYEDIALNNNYVFKKTNNNFPIEVKGPLKPGKYIVDGSISSQFITGLLFALPLLNGDSQIVIKNKLASKNYIDLTLQTLKDADINIKYHNNIFDIKGNQSYKPLTINIEGDYSQAAFFIVASILHNTKITITNLNENSLQGDKEILNIIKQMNVKYSFENTTLTIYPHNNNLTTTDIDLFNIPDLGPILIVLATYLNGTTKFYNVSRLITKESNRLDAMITNLKQQNIKFELKNDTLLVHGTNNFIGNQTFNTYNDHRIAMALAIYGSKCLNPITLNDYTVVNKSYPNFFEHFKLIGGKTNE